MPAYCLSIHTGYGCEHSGACCTAGWPIPLEPAGVTALTDRGLIPRDPAARVTWVTGGGPDQDEPFLAARRDDGACVFFDAGHGRLCTIHREAGEPLLPASCRNFPRIALRDPRGLFVTLSHYCPTAARLLLSAGDIVIVEAPASLTLDGGVEGLDARAVLPPLLRRDMLADHDGYAVWERASIAVLNDRAYPPAGALAIIADATADTCGWRPGGAPLADHAAAAFARTLESGRARPASTSSFDHPIKAFLASHLFASWAGYQLGGLTAVVERVRCALGMLGEVRDETAFIAAVRDADLRLRHTPDHVRSRSLPALRHHRHPGR